MYRRQFVSFVAAALAGLAYGTRARPARAEPSTARGPRYVVSLFLPGGLDAIYGPDPKLRTEVAADVDVPYGANAIVEAGDVRLGPHLAELKPHVGRMAILRGVSMQTANHITGEAQFRTFRTGTLPQMPSLLEIIGLGKDTQTIDCWSWHHDAKDLVTLMKGASVDELGAIAAALRKQATALDSTTDYQRRKSASNLRDLAKLCDALVGVPKFEVAPWGERADFSEHLQWALWLIQNDLARSVEVNMTLDDMPWDSHTANAFAQAKAARNFFPLLARFFQELEKRQNSHGTLAANTLVMLGSEIGRFPGLNGQGGKDHFPEASMIFYGAGINTNGGKGVQFGQTGKRMEAFPISPKTGRPLTGGHAVVLDDVGSTLLRLCGVADPTIVGYSGRFLEFMGT